MNRTVDNEEIVMQTWQFFIVVPNIILCLPVLGSPSSIPVFGTCFERFVCLGSFLAGAHFDKKRRKFVNF